MTETKSHPKVFPSNMPTKIIKSGVFVNKDSKIELLQTQNFHLKQLIEKQLLKNKEYTQKLQENRTKILNKQNQNNILQLETISLQQQITEFENEVMRLEPILLQKQQKVSNLTSQISQTAQHLQNLLKKDQQAKALIQRYKDEIKKEKLICKSDTHLHKLREDLNKKMVNYDKNIDILANKLESKNKYLAILKKKLEKQQKSENNKKESKQGKIWSESRISSNFGSKNSKKYQNNKEDEVPQKNMQAMKDFNNMIRKKNEILNKK